MTDDEWRDDEKIENSICQLTMKPLTRLFFGKKSRFWISIIIGSNDEAPPRSGLLTKPVQARAYETIVLIEYVSCGRIPFS